MKTIYSLISASIIAFFPLFTSAQNSIHFDGANDWLNCGTDASVGMAGLSTMTLEAWIYPTAFRTNVYEGSIFRKEGFGTNGFMLRCGGSGVIEFNVGTGSWGFATSPANTLTLNTWQHVAAVYDGSTMAVYVNGVGVAISVKTGSIGTTTSPLGIGGGLLANDPNSDKRSFHGRIDEARVWNVARTPAQIMSDMNAEFCSPQTGLVAYHKMNNGVPSGNNSGITYSPDASGNGNHGTLTSSSLNGGSSNWVLGNTAISGPVLTSQTFSECSGDTVFVGSSTYTTTGVYVDMFAAASGCDSIVYTDLTVSPSYDIMNTLVQCPGTSVTVGNNTYTTTGVYVDSFTTANGCDSIITTDLTILAPNVTNQTFVECAGSSVTVGNSTYTTSGMYTDVFTSSAGCDSTVITDLTVLDAIQTDQTIVQCYGTTFTVGGSTYTTSGNYTNVLTAANGCDSTVNTDLTIEPKISTTVTELFNGLRANSSIASYQWFDCDNQNAPIPGATNQIFYPTVNGNYGVSLTVNNCSDTSNCYTVTNTGIRDLGISSSISLYPNPVNSELTVKIGDSEFAGSTIQILNTLGQVVMENQFNSTQNSMVLDLSNLSQGMYFFQLISDQNVVYTSKVLKQ
jgi:hypothetical protein